ncbi:MAG: DUF465 domain-containing protein [Thermodesulfobacteriota bacterium]
MGVQDKELLVKRLLEEDEDFRDIYKTHKEYDAKISRIEKKPFLSPSDSAEKSRLKKLKLALKDEIEEVLSRHV